MDFLSPIWLWMYVGAFLMLAELASPGFVVFFFGLAAATVGLVMFVLPDAFHLTPTWQFALFSLFSILSLVTLRRYVKSVFLGDSDDSKATDEYVGRLAKVTETVRPETPGRVMLGDAEWTAVASERLDPGTEVKVTGRKNLTLEVEKVA